MSLSDTDTAPATRTCRLRGRSAHGRAARSEGCALGRHRVESLIRRGPIPHRQIPGCPSRLQEGRQHHPPGGRQI